MVVVSGPGDGIDLVAGVVALFRAIQAVLWRFPAEIVNGAWIPMAVFVRQLVGWGQDQDGQAGSFGHQHLRIDLSAFAQPNGRRDAHGCQRRWHGPFG
ncbi:hypothetical protein [Thiomonas sp. X19]|uniref:hypothetical protein n=1 Tax=Thiomonas sp. X19 TaxID=1050370 RepID=UPI0011BED835|nr:hypothetical protein [Thiomonas sp. X19]